MDYKETVIFSPAKVNLILGVTGQRLDGLHSLVSLVAPLAWGDHLRIALLADQGKDTLLCNLSEVPDDSQNLILRAAAAFRKHFHFEGSFRFILEKRIPVAAGLGGGSSNAVATLNGLNDCLGQPLELETLAALAAELGSDCPLFLQRRPVVIRGQGERVQSLPDEVTQRLGTQRLLIFKPDFSIETRWAYDRLRLWGESAYITEKTVEAWLKKWMAPGTRKPLYNSFEPDVFSKYVTLPVLLNRLKQKYGVSCSLTGSGSACFVLLDKETDVQALRQEIAEAWGPETFIVETSLLSDRGARRALV